jgi:hypothetical protein
MIDYQVVNMAGILVAAMHVLYWYRGAGEIKEGTKDCVKTRDGKSWDLDSP